jgi:hypothetical protein
MAKQEPKPVQLGTASLIAVAIFLLLWNVIERVTDTGPKGAPPGTTYHAANQAGAAVVPSDQPPMVLNQ